MLFFNICGPASDTFTSVVEFMTKSKTYPYIAVIYWTQFLVSVCSDGNRKCPIFPTVPSAQILTGCLTSVSFARCQFGKLHSKHSDAGSRYTDGYFHLQQHFSVGQRHLQSLPFLSSLNTWQCLLSLLCQWTQLFYGSMVVLWLQTFKCYTYFVY